MQNSSDFQRSRQISTVFSIKINKKLTYKQFEIIISKMTSHYYNYINRFIRDTYIKDIKEKHVKLENVRVTLDDIDVKYDDNGNMILEMRCCFCL